ncbi:MAG: sensor histidine kinase [Shewanella sp.]|uniref:sensor histidine kinase n=1 Tax=Shewanella cutis TaxID=2766780 RepID=UPI001F035B3D|nr:PhnD/SsuA/transferrin family substrate-binding protein [Shewanella sp. PS-2]
MYQFFTRLMFILAFFIGFNLPAIAAAPPASDPVRIGIMAFNEPDEVMANWHPTADWLSQQLHRPVHLTPLTPSQLDEALTKQSIDFLIGNALTTVAFKKNYGTSHLLTLVHNRVRSPEQSIGSAIVTRIDNNLSQWDQLKDEKLVSSDPQAFGGFQIFAATMATKGINAYRDIPKLRFIGFPQQKLLQMLLSGEADIAVLPSCVLENAVDKGLVPANKLKVVLKQPHPDFACEVSTQLYPGYALTKLGHTDHKLATQVVASLLQITPDNPAAQQGRYQYWSAPVDDSPVFELLKQLEQWPFVTNWQRLLHNALPWGASFIFALLLGYIHHLRVKRLVVKRTQALSAEITHHQYTQKILLEQQQQFYRAQRVLLTGEMASGIAHELKQPLAGIRYLTQGCIYRLDNTQTELATALNKVINQVDRAQTTIHRLRTFCQQTSDYQHCDLRTVIEETLTLMQPEFQRLKLSPKVSLQTLPVFADASLMQQVLVNLLRNALDAMENVPHKSLVIDTGTMGENIYIHITDAGCGLSDSALERLFFPFETSKPQGLGLGMVICKRIIEEHKGKIDAQHANPGLTIKVTLPLNSQPA